MPIFTITKDYPISIEIEAETQEAALEEFDNRVSTDSPWRIISDALAPSQWSVGFPYDDTDIVVDAY